MLDSVLYSDEPKKVSLPSLIDDDVLDDLYDDADRISSQVKFLSISWATWSPQLFWILVEDQTGNLLASEEGGKMWKAVEAMVALL